MLEVEEPLAGFTTWTGQGHGFGFDDASANEHVRGYVERKILVSILKRSTVASVLEKIANTPAISELTYWVEPVENFGRLETSG